MEDKRILKENKFGSCRIGGKPLKVGDETIGERERNYSRHQIGENRPVESLVVFGTIIDQIEIYDNMIAPVVNHSNICPH